VRTERRRGNHDLPVMRSLHTHSQILPEIFFIDFEKVRKCVLLRSFRTEICTERQ
jgi:hypothetical protein